MWTLELLIGRCRRAFKLAYETPLLRGVLASQKVLAVPHARKFHKSIFLLLGLLLLSSPAFAQFTQVSGTVKDPNGIAYAGATISATIVPGSGASPTLNAVGFSGVTSPVGLDKNGKFNMQLADNNVILPAGSKWQFTVNMAPGILPPAGTGPQTFTATITITGASQDISATLNALAPALSLVTGGLSFVSSLPATCTPGVTASVQLSVAPYQIYFCDATNHWTASNIAPGAAAQCLNLFVSGGYPSGNFFGICAPASMAASLQYTAPTLDAALAYGSLVSDAAQHLSFNPGPARIITADWTCGTGGVNTSCVSAQTISTLTFTLPLLARSWTVDCEGVVGQATAATANSWNIQTAANGATNLTAWYSMNTAVTAMTGGAVTDVASTTTTQVIAPTWTLGGTGTKMPFHIRATVEGASVSGTVVNIQLVAPTVADLVTIYRGSQCSIY